MRPRHVLFLVAAIAMSTPASAQDASPSMLSQMTRMMETVQRLKAALPEGVLTPEIATFVFQNLSSVDFVMRQLAPEAVAERCRITVDADAESLMQDGRAVVNSIMAGETPGSEEIDRLRTASETLSASIARSLCAAQIRQALDHLKSWSGLPVRI